MGRDQREIDLRKRLMFCVLQKSINNCLKFPTTVSTFLLKCSALSNRQAFNHSPALTCIKYAYYHSTKTAPSKNIAERKDSPKYELSTAQKVQQAGKDVTYGAIVLVGLGVTGIMFYAIGRELFSTDSPNGVYKMAFKRCRQEDRVLDAFGTPLKCHGEADRRGRTRHVNHMSFESEGKVHLEVRKGENGKWEYKYLIVEFDDIVPRTFI